MLPFALQPCAVQAGPVPAVRARGGEVSRAGSGQPLRGGDGGGRLACVKQGADTAKMTHSRMAFASRDCPSQAGRAIDTVSILSNRAATKHDEPSAATVYALHMSSVLRETGSDWDMQTQ